MNCHYVEIRAFVEDKVATRMGPMSERRADRISDAANVNLNHETHYTIVVTNETGEFPDAEASESN